MKFGPFAIAYVAMNLDIFLILNLIVGLASDITGLAIYHPQINSESYYSVLGAP